MQKIYLTYKALARVAVNQSKRKINSELTIHIKINKRIKNQCLQTKLNFPKWKETPRQWCQNTCSLFDKCEIYQQVY